METFGRGRESQKFERRRVVAELVPRFDATLQAVPADLIVPRVNQEERRLREARSVLAEQLKEYVTGALDNGHINADGAITIHDALARAQLGIFRMRRDVAIDIGLTDIVDKVQEQLVPNVFIAEGYRERYPNDLLFEPARAALDAQGELWQSLHDILHVEDDPADLVGIIRRHINMLPATGSSRAQLLFLKRSIDALGVMSNERDHRLSNAIHEGSYQDNLRVAYVKLRQTVAQLH